MSSLPIVENAYRDFLAKEHEIFEWFCDHAGNYLQTTHGIGELPEQVPLPGALPWSFVMNMQRIELMAGELKESFFKSGQASPLAHYDSEGLLEAYFDVYGANLPQNIDNFWFRHLFYANYQRTRQTYHIKPTLWEQLEGMEWPEDAPAETLKHLPLPGFALRSPEDTIYTVCYDLLSGEEGSGELEIRVGTLEKDRTIKGFTLLHLGDPNTESITIEEGFRRGVNTLVEGMTEDAEYITTGEERYTPSEFEEYLYNNAQRIVNVLLYLAGEDDIVDRVGHYPDPYKRHKRSLENTAYAEDLEEDPDESDVGVRMQQAFRQYRTEDKSSDEGGNESSKKPHVRRPHPHLYWVGEGREIPKIKYLGPISVNTDDGEVPPTEQDLE